MKHTSPDFNKAIFNAFPFPFFSPKLISPAFGGNSTDSVSHCPELFCFVLFKITDIISLEKNFLVRANYC